MSKTALSAFDEFLEQTLASLPVRAGRRQEMRDELLAHLLCIFDDELARCGDVTKAVAQTLRASGTRMI